MMHPNKLHLKDELARRRLLWASEGTRQARERLQQARQKAQKLLGYSSETDPL